MTADSGASRLVLDAVLTPARRYGAGQERVGAFPGSVGGAPTLSVREAALGQQA